MTDRAQDGILAELADREAIRELVNQYAHQVWRNDIPAIAALFAEDGVMDTDTQGVIQGRDAIARDYKRLLADNVFRPFVHNHIIDLDGDEATGTVYLDLRATVDGVDQLGAGYYNDHYVRADGEWRFSSRKLNLVSMVPMP